MPKVRTPLSRREREFVRLFLVGKRGIRGNATQAAIAAGYSARSARQSASRLMARAAIQDAIAHYDQKAEIDAVRVLREMQRIALSDMRDFADWGPDGVVLKPSTELSDEAAVCVAEVEERRRTRTEAGSNDAAPAEIEDRHVRFKLHDKVSALRDLAKHLGLLRERVEHTGRGGGPIEVHFFLPRNGREADSSAPSARPVAALSNGRHDGPDNGSGHRGG